MAHRKDQQKQSGNVALIAIIAVLFLGAVVLIGMKKTKPVSTPFTTTQKATSSSPSQMTKSGATPQDLTFTGVVSGRMTEGRRGDTYACLTVATGPIVGKIGNTDYTFEYRALTAKGAGTYKGYVQIGPLNNKNLYYGGDGVDVTINPDKRSGAVEGNLSNLSNSAEKVHISGTWECPPDF